MTRSVFSFFREAEQAWFNPEFDDRKHYPEVFDFDLKRIPLGARPGGFSVVEDEARAYYLYGRIYPNPPGWKARVLKDSNSRIWMSDHPQEMMMMCANAVQAKGLTLVGGLGLGVFPQYAEKDAFGQASQFVFVERDKSVIDLVEPVLRKSLTVPYCIIHSSIEDFLNVNRKLRFDTIFLDTWSTLSPQLLPEVDRLRDMAVRQLHRGGVVLLWGYRWMQEMLNQGAKECFLRTIKIKPGNPAVDNSGETFVEFINNTGTGMESVSDYVSGFFSGYRSVDFSSFETLKDRHYGTKGVLTGRSVDFS